MVGSAPRFARLLVAGGTIGRDLKDLDQPDALSGLVHRPGSSRQALTVSDLTLLEEMRQLLERATMGDLVRPLLWVSKSPAKLAASLRAKGHQIAMSTIPRLLGLLKYRRQVNRKILGGSRNPDRSAQFEHITAAVIAAQAAGQAVSSIDRPDASGLSLAARNFEVEQDRGSAVLPHHPNLARWETDQSACCG